MPVTTQTAITPNRAARRLETLMLPQRKRKPFYDLCATWRSVESVGKRADEIETPLAKLAEDADQAVRSGDTEMLDSRDALRSIHAYVRTIQAAAQSDDRSDEDLSDLLADRIELMLAETAQAVDIVYAAGGRPPRVINPFRAEHCAEAAGRNFDDAARELSALSTLSPFADTALVEAHLQSLITAAAALRTFYRSSEGVSGERRMLADALLHSARQYEALITRTIHPLALVDAIQALERPLLSIYWLRRIPAQRAA